MYASLLVIQAPDYLLQHMKSSTYPQPTTKGERRRSRSARDPLSSSSSSSSSCCAVPLQHRLAVTLSALVLSAYILSMIGILSVALDSDGSPGPGSGSKRALRLSSPLHGRSDRDYIPPAGSQWPTTIRNEVFERINHPANESIQWTVPKFWSRPIHEQTLMDRHRAMQIGTCSVADSLGSVLRGADCPTHQRTIFVAIASYRDFQCRETIESIYSRASFPDRIRVGVVDQIVAGVDTACNQPIRPCNEDANQALCRYQHLIDVITIHAKESVGPVPARHVGHRMYRGEYYAAQVDAHLGFASRWDTSLILELESTGNEMAVLSTYLSDVSGAMDEDGNVLKTGRPIMCNCYWKESLQHFHIHHSVQPEGPPAIRGSPQLHPWWSAGFSFSRGHFVVNVPYDLYQPMVFSGEEMSIALRGWSMGYDFYSPEKSVCFHYYQENEANIKKRGSVPTFWENADGFQGSGVAGMRRMLGIVHMLPEDDSSDWDHRQVETYGLGGVRKPEQLMEILGIHVTERTMESHVCKFVNPGTMHKMFTPKLRPDGMGIDYSGVDYHWLDPDGNEVRMDRKVGDSQAEADDDEDDANNEDDGENGAAPE